MDYIELYKSGMSIPQVSKITGIPLSTIRFRLYKLNLLRSREEGVNLAARDGRLGSGGRGKKREFSEEWKKNISKGKTGKGKGFSKKPNGYIEITMGKNKGRSQHTVIMEEHIGRRLFSNECVHHKDGNKTNNDIDNLELMTRSAHARLHAIERNKRRNKTEEDDI